MASNFANQENRETDQNWGDLIDDEVWNTSIEGASKVMFYKSFSTSSNAEEASNVINCYELDDNKMMNSSSSEEFEHIDNIELMLCSDKSSDDESVASFMKEVKIEQYVRNCNEELNRPSSSSSGSEFEVLDDNNTSSPKQVEGEEDVRNCNEELNRPSSSSSGSEFEVLDDNNTSFPKEVKRPSSSSSEFEVLKDNSTSSPKEAESEEDVQNCNKKVKRPSSSSSEFEVLDDNSTSFPKEAENEENVRNYSEEVKRPSLSSSEFEMFPNETEALVPSFPKTEDLQQNFNKRDEEGTTESLQRDFNNKRSEDGTIKKVGVASTLDFNDSFSSEELEAVSDKFIDASSSDDEDKSCSKATCPFKDGYNRLCFVLKKQRLSKKRSQEFTLKHLVIFFALGVLFTVLCTAFNYIMYTKVFGPIFPPIEPTLPPKESTLPPIEPTLPPMEPILPPEAPSVPTKTSIIGWEDLSEQFIPVLNRLKGWNCKDKYCKINVEERMENMDGITFTMVRDKMLINIGVNDKTYIIYEQEDGSIDVQMIPKTLSKHTQKKTKLLFTLPKKTKERNDAKLCPFIKTVRKSSKMMDSILIDTYLFFRFSIIALFTVLKLILLEILENLSDYLLHK